MTSPDTPSAWRHRIPVIVLSLVGLVVAMVLTLFQVGVGRSTSGGLAWPSSVLTVSLRTAG